MEIKRCQRSKILEKNNPVSTIRFAYKMYNYTIIETGFAYSNGVKPHTNKYTVDVQYIITFVSKRDYFLNY